MIKYLYCYFVLGLRCLNNDLQWKSLEKLKVCKNVNLIFFLYLNKILIDVCSDK